LLEQHRAMNAAIQQRDPVAARAAVAGHMDFVDHEMTAMRRAERNEATARLRLSHNGDL
jgi:GntR family transcriptional repressor for pyruvate dehydrogenase complex